MGTKFLTVLVFLFLVVPGSGQLRWDGLPLSTRLEFATLALFTIAVLNRDIRRNVRKWLSTKAWRSAVKPMIVLLVLAKLLTFAWYPFGDGFDACYRSLYVPLENPGACEKSYEGPFLRRSDLGLSNTSRIDRTVDFGTNMHDWSLPFMNEYPRLGSLWLSRFPFTATYGAIVVNNTSVDQFLPIFSNGELEASLANNRVNQSAIPLVDRYQFSRLDFLPVPTEPSELLVKYKYTDDDTSTPPDTEPPRRGPYAQLKIGEPLSRNQILKFTKVRIRGWTIDLERDATPDAILAVNAKGTVVARAAPENRPDVANYWKRPSLTMGGFNFLVPARELTTGNISIKAIYGQREISIGMLAGNKLIMPLPPVTKVYKVGEVQTQIESWFDADRNDFAPLAPEGRYDMGRLFRLLTVLIDGISALIFIMLAWLVARQLRWWLLIGLAFGVLAYVLFDFAWSSAPSLLGSRLLLPFAIFASVFVVFHRRWISAPTVVFLPAAIALAYVLVFDFLDRFFSGGRSRWWGRLLYYWRDSDWYATRGYARQVFLSGSAHGGESVFWFQAGPRYLSLATQSLLGENDVLIGLLAASFGVFAFIYMAAEFLRRSDALPERIVAGVVLVIGLLFLSEGTIAGFGFVGSSEHPTWISLFAITGFFLSRRKESRTWLLVTLSVVLGYCVQLRPNQIGGIVALFIALLLYVDRSDRQAALGNIARMTTSFGLVTSLSLLHNLYYGESFVPFTANGGINVAFEWTNVFSTGDYSAVWQQVRTMMYWHSSGNWSWALAFWGSQLLWASVLALRARQGALRRAETLFLLIPFGYALPMLKYQMSSYYPRHLVAINLAFLCMALIAWPRAAAARRASIA